MKKWICKAVVLYLFATLLFSSCSLSQSSKNTDTADTSNTYEENITHASETDTVNEITGTEEILTEEALPEAVVSDSIPEERSLSFIACGDNIIYYGNVLDARQTDGSYSFLPCYSDVAPYIQEADIAFINQETLMCGKGFEFSYYPRFNGPQELGCDLISLGFDVINITNNHMLDKDENGLRATSEFWESQNVLLLGAYKNDGTDIKNISVIERNGIKIAFLNYTEHTNLISLKKDSEYLVPYMNEELIREQVKYANELADLIIVSVHWGDEGSLSPNETQKTYAKIFADLGVKIVIGHHPHAIQPIEWVYSDDGSNKMLCIYSLGNFVAEMKRDINMLGGMIKFDIHTLDGSFSEISNIEFIPTVFDFTTAFTNNHVYLLKDYTSDMAKKHGIRAYGNSTSLTRLQALVTDTINKEFLSESFLESLE